MRLLTLRGSVIRLGAGTGWVTSWRYNTGARGWGEGWRRNEWQCIVCMQFTSEEKHLHIGPRYADTVHGCYQREQVQLFWTINCYIIFFCLRLRHSMSSISQYWHWPPEPESSDGAGAGQRADSVRVSSGLTRRQTDTFPAQRRGQASADSEVLCENLCFQLTTKYYKIATKNIPFLNFLSSL